MLPPNAALAASGAGTFCSSPRAGRAASWRALLALTKPRLAAMSVLTTAIAYFTAKPAAGAANACMLVAGTALSAGGALALNHWRERRTDALMRRTCHRPIPAGDVSPRAALAWSLALTISGTGGLAIFVNVTAALLAAATTVIYGLIYTPMKRRTRWATEIGSVSGALPALIGNAGAGDLFAMPGIVLTALLLLWQMPHFFAIGWRHRADYRAAGFPLLPAIDPTGARTGAWCTAYAALLWLVSLVPWACGWLGPIYGITAAVAGAHFVRCAWRLAVDAAHRDRAATRLFAASLVYLPLVMGALMIERWPA